MSQETTQAEKSTLPLSWLRTFSPELYQLDESPLLGNPRPFPWEKLSKNISDLLGIGPITIAAGEVLWREKEDLLRGINEPRITTHIIASGIEGDLFFSMGKADLEWLTSACLKISEQEVKAETAELLNGFHQFLALETLQIINTLDFDKKVSLRLAPNKDIQQEPHLCQDIWITYQDKRILGRLLISNQFRKLWKNIKVPTPSNIAQSLLETVLITLNVEAGRTTLKLPDLLEISQGDLLLLDHPFYVPGTDQERLLLTLKGKPLFRAKLKNGNLKILEIPLHHEVYDSMVDTHHSESNDEDTSHVEDSNTEHEESTELEETDEHDESSEDDDEESSIDDTEDDFDEEEEEDFDLVEETTNAAEQPSTETVETHTKVQPAAEKTKKHVAAKESLKFSGPLTTNEIDVPIIVEVACISMSVQKLLALEPGNLIDLEIAPENGVNLVANGRIIGRGELIKVGESVGVRILEIGKIA